MSDGITITLNAKTEQAVSGLQSFFNSFQQRLSVLDEFNKKIENGSAALNQMLATAGAALGFEALKQFAEKSLSASKGQEQLEAAMRSTGQYSDEYRAELAANAE